MKRFAHFSNVQSRTTASSNGPISFQKTMSQARMTAADLSPRKRQFSIVNFRVCSRNARARVFSTEQFAMRTSG